MTPTINPISFTCKLIADVIPGVLSVGLTGWSTVPPQVLLQVPAFSFIKGVEEKGELLNVSLRVLTSPENTRLTDHQWTNQTRMKVPLLEKSRIILIIFLSYNCTSRCLAFIETKMKLKNQYIFSFGGNQFWIGFNTN